MSERDLEREQEELAAAEAGGIGGRPTSEPPPIDQEGLDEAHRPLVEAGEGEAEGFEEAERELIEHASHGDEHNPFKITKDSWDEEEEGIGTGGEADHEHSSELEEDTP